MAEDTTQPIQSFIRKLEWRARRRQAGAYGFLGLMALGIGAAAYVFIQAKQITDRETASNITKRMSDVRDNIEENKRKINEIAGSLEILYRDMLNQLPIATKESCNVILNNPNSGDHFFLTSPEETINTELRPKSQALSLLKAKHSRPFDPPNPDCISIELRLLHQSFIFDLQKLQEFNPEYWNWNKSDFPNLLKERDTLNRQAQSYQRALLRLQQLFEQKELEPLTGEQENQNTALSLPFLLQLNITRFGTITLVVIALGIIAPLYRFSARLAAFYRSRADIFRLHQISGYKRIGIEQLSPIFTPTFDFGKSQTMPDNLTELIRATLAHGKGSE